MDMQVDFFARQGYGKVALRKFGNVSENFRLCEAGWIDKDPKSRSVMEVIGAEFRIAKTGAYKGKLSVLIKGTERTVYVTAEEMVAEEIAIREHLACVIGVAASEISDDAMDDLRYTPTDDAIRECWISKPWEKGSKDKREKQIAHFNQ